MRDHQRVIWTALLVAAASVGLTETALPHDHQEPATFLLVGEQRQEARWVTSTWVSRYRAGARRCYVVHADGRPGPYFPEAMPTSAGVRRVAVRFLKRRRPSSVEVDAWRIDPGIVDAPPEPVGVDLVRRRRQGRTFAWDAVWRPLVLGDYYMRVEAHWDDQQECEGDQSLIVTFHVRGAP